MDTFSSRALLILWLGALAACGGEAGAPDLGGPYVDLAADLGAAVDLATTAGDMSPTANPCAVVRCSAGYLCKDGACVVDPGGSWALTLGAGTISATGPDGSAWDPVGGAPDPYVCLTYAGQRQCGAVKDDTLAPAFSDMFPAAPANNLLGGVLFELWDQDGIDPDDAICAAAVVPVTEEDFRAGRFTAACRYGSIQVALRRL